MKNLIKRLSEFALFILILSFASFALVKLAPGDAARKLLRADDVAIDAATIERQREALGLDQPLWQQYGEWLSQLVRFDLGQSYMTNRPVAEELLSRMPATLMLAGFSLLIVLSIALPLGIAAALRPYRPIDRLTQALSIIGTSIPSFWLGLLLIDFFSVQTGWLPSMGVGTPQHLILPSLTLGLTMAAVYMRIIRSSLRDSLQQDFIRGVTSRGVPRFQVVFVYALRHALNPVLTMFGISLGSLLGGAVVVEVLFAYPGMGKLVIDAIHNRDYPVIQGYMVLMAITITLCNMAVDALQLWLNPKMRVQGADK